jgi:alkanesulfonate monooxygenase SsuD/methylene tetrahydromethanopterin reductase-like flavin-dependent oxidoreductase (luciferase family)
MRIGIGLPNAVPGRPPRELAHWARESERLGFHSLGTIDRLVYDILDPLACLAAVAAVTERIQLFTSVLNVGWRNNPVLFAKQLATVDLMSGGRLTAGVGMGGWPDDFTLSRAPDKGRGRLFDEALTEMRRVWDGDVTSIAGPTPLPGAGRPRLLIAGLVPAGYARVARFGDGWVSPLLNRQILNDGIRGVGAEWERAGRTGRPQILTGRYFGCGPDAATDLTSYLAHYYGRAQSAAVRADSLDTDERLRDELSALARAGVDDLVLYPSSSSVDQVHLLAAALERIGVQRDPTFVLGPQTESAHSAPGTLGGGRAPEGDGEAEEPQDGERRRVGAVLDERGGEHHRGAGEAEVGDPAAEGGSAEDHHGDRQDEQREGRHA